MREQRNMAAHAAPERGDLGGDVRERVGLLVG
jgi:hypothetical protein